MAMRDSARSAVGGDRSGSFGGAGGNVGSGLSGMGERSGNSRISPGQDVQADPYGMGQLGGQLMQKQLSESLGFGPFMENWQTMDAALLLSGLLTKSPQLLSLFGGPASMIGSMLYNAMNYFNQGGRADWTAQGTAAYGDVTGQTGGATVGKPTEKTVAPAPAKPGEPAPQEVKPAEPETGAGQAVQGSLGGRDAAIRAQSARSGGPQTSGSPLGLDTVAPTKRKRLLGA